MPAPVRQHLPRLLLAVALGAAAGAVVLGVGGRLLMRVVAALIGEPVGFSLGGSLEVVATGAIYGALGGALLLILPRNWPRGHVPLHAVLMFIAFATTSPAARGASGSVPGTMRAVVLLMFLALLVGYSWVVLSWWRSRPARQSTPPS